jgi:hypothetical protein
MVSARCPLIPPQRADDRAAANVPVACFIIDLPDLGRHRKNQETRRAGAAIYDDEPALPAAGALHHIVNGHRGHFHTWRKPL